MKKMMSFILVLMMVSPAVFARGGGKGGFGKILKQLELTDAQKKQLKEMRQKNKDSRADNREEVKKLREEMRTKFASEASESEVRALHEKMKTIRSQRNEKRFNKMMEIRKILTVEQRKKFQDLQRERRGKRNRGNE